MPGQSRCHVVRYRFQHFTLSPRRRILIHEGREVPLIPRYFDLLLLLIEKRGEAVHRREIFDRVWSDVIVSDSALSQAIRTIRRTLDDDPREPRFIRTVSRHGYQFVCADLIVEDDGDAWPPVSAASPDTTADQPAAPPVAPTFEPLLERVSRPAVTASDDEERREAAELLHALGTAEALRRLGTRPGHVEARAVLRDARWEAPGAGEVPVFGGPEPMGVVRELLHLRLRRAARVVAWRSAGGALGAALAGGAAGGLGGLLLAAAPGSAAPLVIAAVLAVIGGVCGAIGGAGVAAGLAVAEAATRSYRVAALTLAGAVGGGLVGGLLQWLVHGALAVIVGLDVVVGGGLDGLAIGAAAGLGVAIATGGAHEGLAAPSGHRRWQAALVTAVCCGLAGVALTSAGRPLVGGTIHALAEAAEGSRATLAPLGRLIGEPDFGPITRLSLAGVEGALFGGGLALGLLRRPRRRALHEPS